MPRSKPSRLRCYSLTVGASRAGKRGKLSRRVDQKIEALTTERFPSGYSIVRVHGGWYDPDSKAFIAEESRQILVCASSVRPVHALARDLAEALGQKEILVVALGAATTITRRTTG